MPSIGQEPVTSNLCQQQRKHSMRRTCARLYIYINDPSMQCHLFDTLVLPILSYACEVWAVDEKAGDLGEQLHRQFLRHLIGVRDNVASMVVLAELGRFPLRLHWWQQILRFHNRAHKMSDTRLVKSAFLDSIDSSYLFWTHKVRNWLQQQNTCLNVQLELDITSIIENSKVDYISAYHSSDLISVILYRSLQPEYNIARHLTQEVSLGLQSRRVTSRFRCACHGLQVDVGRFVSKEQQIPREQRLCCACSLHTAEDEHHFLFDCPAYSLIRSKFDNIFWGPVPSVASFLNMHDPKVVPKFMKECFKHRNLLLGI